MICPYCGKNFKPDVQNQKFCYWRHGQRYRELKLIKEKVKLNKHDLKIWEELHNEKSN